MARKPHVEEAEDGERWLLTYADMMTLLVALFIVLFSISSVNVSKLETVQKSLDEALSGKVLPGGKGVTEGASSEKSESLVSSPFMPDPTAMRTQEEAAAGSTGAAADPQQEAADLERVEEQVRRAAVQAGVSGKVSTRLERDGLHVRILADEVLFASASAQLQPEGAALMQRLGSAFRRDAHAVVVEGHTDSVPIQSAQYPSNWELSSARASAVVRSLSGAGVAGSRLTAVGRADLDPAAGGSTSIARALDRRVEILLPRRASS